MIGAQQLLLTTGRKGGVALSDSFGGAGAMGLTEVGGQPWEALVGTWTRDGGRAITPASRDTNPLVVADALTPNVLATLTGIGSGSDALYFRVRDASNWWRVRVRYHVTTQPSTVTQHQWSCTSGLSSLTGDNHFHSTTSWGGCTGVTHAHSGRPMHSHSASHPSAGSIPAYQNRRTGETREVSGGSETVYLRNTYLEKSVNGVITIQGNYADLPGNQISVAAQGSAIEVAVDGTPRIAISNQDHLGETRHGVGLGPSEDGSPDLNGWSVVPLVVAA